MMDPKNSVLVQEALDKIHGAEIEPLSPIIVFRADGRFDTTVEVSSDKETTILRFHVHTVCGLPGLESHMQEHIVSCKSFDSYMIYERGEDIVGKGMAYYVHLKMPPLLPRREAFLDAIAVGQSLARRIDALYLGLNPADQDSRR